MESSDCRIPATASCRHKRCVSKLRHPSPRETRVFYFPPFFRLRAAGIELIDENGGGSGVCLRKRQRLEKSK